MVSLRLEQRRYTLSFRLHKYGDNQPLGKLHKETIHLGILFLGGKERLVLKFLIPGSPVVRVISLN
jgi:hypothetical protein